MEVYKKFIQLFNEYKIKPNGKRKLKVINESYRLMKLGHVGHLGVK